MTIEGEKSNTTEQDEVRLSLVKVEEHLAVLDSEDRGFEKELEILQTRTDELEAKKDKVKTSQRSLSERREKLRQERRDLRSKLDTYNGGAI